MADADTSREAVERLIREAESATDGCGWWMVANYDTHALIVDNRRSTVAHCNLIANAERLVGAVHSAREAAIMLPALLARAERAEAEAARLRRGIESAMREIEDAGPKALLYAEQELRSALREDQR